jgi:hypothetical protein
LTKNAKEDYAVIKEPKRFPERLVHYSNPFSITFAAMRHVIVRAAVAMGTTLFTLRDVLKCCRNESQNEGAVDESGTSFY